jgi:hypothetical protein
MLFGSVCRVNFAKNRWIFLLGRREEGDAVVRSSADGSVVFAPPSVLALPCHPDGQSGEARFSIAPFSRDESASSSARHSLFEHRSLRGQRSKFGRDYKEVLRVVSQSRLLSLSRLAVGSRRLTVEGPDIVIG